MSPVEAFATGIKMMRSTFFLGADQGIKTNSERPNIKQLTHFLRYLAGMAIHFVL